MAPLYNCNFLDVHKDMLPVFTFNNQMYLGMNIYKHQLSSLKKNSITRQSLLRTYGHDILYITWYIISIQGFIFGNQH